MAFQVFDRVQETTTTTGTGTVTLAGAVSGFRSFSNAGLNNGDTTYYCITSGTAWEVGLGTFSTGPNAIARTTILASSNFGSAITLAGTSNVFCVYPASKAVYKDVQGSVGIGTNTPLQFFSAYDCVTLEINTTAGHDTSLLRLYEPNNGVDFRLAATGPNTQALIGTYSTVPLVFYADSTEAMRITATGRLGIGTTSPATPLHVNGTITATALTLTNALGLANGGTGRTTAPAAQAAIQGFTTTATAGGTTSLINTSSVYQLFTGTLAQTITLPNTATLAQGWFFHICNNSTGTLTLQTSTAVSLGTVPSGLTVMVSCIDTTVNTAAAWEYGYTDFSTITGTGSAVLATAPTVSRLSLAAGTATAGTAPLKFTSGTNLTTAEAGAMEYDGENLYFSGEASQRGVVIASQFAILTSDYTTPLGTANVLKQAFNSTTNGALTLTLGSYLFECLLNLSSLSATSGTIAFGFGGTALGRFRYLATANKTATSTTAANTTFSNTAAATIITPATTTTTGYALVQGSIVITTAGTIIPSIALSVAAANVVVTGSYFNLTPIGSSTVQTVGNWS